MTETPCQADPIITTPEFRARLESIEEAAHEVEDVYHCELDDGHSGAHWSLGQSDCRNDDVWLRWTDGQPPILLSHPACDSEMDEEICVLPDGHPGRHSNADVRW